MFFLFNFTKVFHRLLFLFFVAYAKDHQPCIIFMDEIDAIGNWFYILH